jgi:hypothetical protein
LHPVTRDASVIHGRRPARNARCDLEPSMIGSDNP